MQTEARTMEELKTLAPIVGKTYVPEGAPNEPIYVEAVSFVEADEDCDAGFFVEGCDPKDVGDMGAIGYELHSDEWIEQGFTPVSA